MHRQAAHRVDRQRTVDVQFHLLAHHHLGEQGFVGVLGGHVAHIFTTAQNGHPVADGQHLMQLVGDNDNGLAVGFHVAHDGKELFGLLGGEHGGGFVQDQDVGTAVQHLDDLQRLFLADAHLVDFLVQVQGKAVLFADGTGPAADLLQVVFFPGFHAQGNVFQRGEHIHQLEMLMDHADAQRQCVAGGADIHHLVPHIDFAFVGVIDTGDHVHQGGFAGPVLPQKGEDLAPADFQSHIMVGRHFAKGLGDVFQPDGILRVGHALPSPFTTGREARKSVSFPPENSCSDWFRPPVRCPR